MVEVLATVKHQLPARIFPVQKVAASGLWADLCHHLLPFQNNH